MRDEEKTKEQLISELNELRHRISESNIPDDQHNKIEFNKKSVAKLDRQLWSTFSIASGGTRGQIFILDKISEC